MRQHRAHTLDTLDPVCCFYLGANCGVFLSHTRTDVLARASLTSYTCVVHVGISRMHSFGFMNGERPLCYVRCARGECVLACGRLQYATDVFRVCVLLVAYF